MNLRRIFRYLRKPYFIENREELTRSQFVKKTLIYTGISLVIAVPLAVFLDSLFTYTGLFSGFEHRQTQTLAGISSIHMVLTFIFSVGVIVPILEESIFRLPLSLKWYHLILASLYPLVISFFSPKGVIVTIGAVLVGMSIVMFIISIKHRHLLIKYYHFVFYFLSISFALVHLGNYKGLEFKHILLLPFLVITQWMIGVMLSYVRVRYQRGFSMAILIHGFCNGIALGGVYIVSYLQNTGKL